MIEFNWDALSDRQDAYPTFVGLKLLECSSLEAEIAQFEEDASQKNY